MFEDLREISRISKQYKQAQTLISTIDSGVFKQLHDKFGRVPIRW